MEKATNRNEIAAVHTQSQELLRTACQKHGRRIAYPDLSLRRMQMHAGAPSHLMDTQSPSCGSRAATSSASVAVAVLIGPEVLPPLSSALATLYFVRLRSWMYVSPSS